MSFYDEMAAFVQEMLVEFGESATLTSQTSAFNKRTGRTETTAGDVTECRAVIVQPTPFDNDKSRLVKTTTAVCSVLPVEGSTLTLGARSWTVGKVTVVQPTIAPICYMAEVE